MNRRRILWLCVPLVLIGVAVATWLVLGRRDADFVTVGPKTKGVCVNFVKLDMMIDPADFRDCKTVQDALSRLSEIADGQLPMFDDFPKIRRIWFHRIRADHDVFNLDGAGKNSLESRFQLPSDTRPMPLKQFLRMTIAQTGLEDVAFVVRGVQIEATTAKRAQEERARYLDSVSLYDRMHSLWKEITGVVEEDDPTEFLLMNTNVW